jgi:glycosyltransferase involved in cell wall biosynthesis
MASRIKVDPKRRGWFKSRMSTQVSIIIPMRNAEDYVAQALNSILSETQVSLEVVVVDDGSTDGSRRVVESVADSRVRVVSGTQQGISAALNVGLRHAAGEVIMRCDADDLYPASRIRAQMQWLADHPAYGAVCGQFDTIDSLGRSVSRLLRSHATFADINSELSDGITRTHLCTFAIRREFTERLGGFRTYFETAEDIDFSLRLGNICRVAYLPEVFYFYRLHDSSITHTQKSSRRIFFEQTARDFQLQRAHRGTDDLDSGTPPSAPENTLGNSNLANDHVYGMLVGQAWSDIKNGQRIQALGLMLRALKIRPFNWDAWKHFFKLALHTLKPPS